MIKNSNETPTKTLITMFNMANRKFPCFNNSKVSKLNVEKVLNPPQKPVIMNNLNAMFPEIFSFK